MFSKLLAELKNIGRGLSKLRFFRFGYLSKTWRFFNRKEKIIAAALMLILCADIIFGATRFYIKHTHAIAGSGGTYSEGLIGEPRFINPLLAQTQTDKDISHLVFSGLYKFDDQDHMVPDLASGDPQIASSQKQYTVTLKKDLKWHDGQPITADDVIFTVQTLQNPAYNSPLRSAWSSIKAEKIDDYTIKFSNSEISAPFISNLTLGIMPKHVWSNVEPANFALSKFNLEPVGNGPFLVKEINKTASGQISSINLEAYANYWAGKANIDNIVFKFYKNYEDLIFGLHTKEIENLGFVPFDKKVYVDQNRTNLKISQFPIFQYQALFFNFYHSPKVLADKDVRTALAKSVDREAFINDVYYGLAKPAYGAILPGQLGYNDNVSYINNYDIAYANALLDKAGWTVDQKTGYRAKNNQQLAFTITTNDFVLNVKSAEALRDQWKKIGANISIATIPTLDFEKNNLRPRNFDALLFSESTGFDPDPFVFWHSSQAQDPGLNVAQYKSTAADRLISDARTTFDPAKRAHKYADLQTLMANDIPAIFLDQSVFVYELNPSLRGMQIQNLAEQEDRFYDIGHWYLATRRVWNRK